MLLNLREYRRPATEGGDLQDALELLARRDIRTVPLAGGDTLVGSGDHSVEAVVDLQGLHLDQIGQDLDPPVLRIGALVTRTMLADWSLLFRQQDGGTAEQENRAAFLGNAARRWRGSVQRNRATVGGAIVAAASDDAMVAALLVCGATLEIQGPAGARRVSMADFVARRGALLGEPAIITDIVVPLAGGLCTLETVARTPSDSPIVLVAACVYEGGARLAIGGAGHTMLLLPVAEAVTPESIPAIVDRVGASVDPVGDFRGSAEYRRAMVRVLTERALSGALQGAN